MSGMLIRIWAASKSLLPALVRARMLGVDLPTGTSVWIYDKWQPSDCQQLRLWHIVLICGDAHVSGERLDMI